MAGKGRNGKNTKNGKSKHLKLEIDDSRIRIRNNIFIGIILFYTFILFYKTLSFQFVNWDDPFYITDNIYIRDFSLEGLKKIFTTPIIGMYNPLVFLLYSIEFKIWGLDPKAFHFVNLIFHLIATITVYRFIFLLTKRWETSVIVTLLFAIHPMHISVVTWISQTKTSIFLIFYFLALGKYLKYINSGFKIKYLIYAGLLMILSALSKPTAVTLAPILLLLDYYLSRKFDKRLIIEKIPFFAIAIFFGILTLLTHSQAEDSIFDVNQDYSLINNILVSNYSIVFYINKLFFPFNLCTIYPYPENTNFLPLRYYLSLPIIPIILFLIYKAGNFRKEMIFGILFFVIAISVLIRIVPSGFFRAANRYTYLSYTGLFLIIGQYIVYVIDNKFSYSRKIKGSLIALFCLYIVMLSVLTFQRIDVWQNSITLFDDIIRKKPKLVIAYNNRAIAKKDIGDYEGAIADFSKSIEIDPKYAPAFNNRGEIKRLLKDDKAALNDYNEAIRLNPKYVEAYNNRGIVLYNQGKLSEAMVDYNTAISLNSKNGATYNNRAIVKFIQKDTLGALEDWKKAKELGIAEANKPIELFNSAFTANNNPDKD